MKKNHVGFCFHGASEVVESKLPFEWDKQPIKQVLNTRQEGTDSSGLFGNPDLKSHTLGARGSPSRDPLQVGGSCPLPSKPGPAREAAGFASEEICFSAAESSLPGPWKGVML